MHRLKFLLNRLQTGHKSLKGQSVAPPHLEAPQVTIATIYTQLLSLFILYTKHSVLKFVIIFKMC